MSTLGLVSGLEPLVGSLRRENRPIMLYGMGNGAEKIYAYLTARGVKISGVVASEGFLRGQSFLGFPVLGIPEAAARFGSLCLVVCFGTEGERSRFLYDLRGRHRVVSPNLPVFGGGAMDAEYIAAEHERLDRTRALLCDDISRRIFDSLVAYNYTGDIDFIKDSHCFTPPDGFFRGGVHIDIGAYDGDTALEYARKSADYDEIIAFEPDKTAFSRLAKRPLPRLRCENLLVGNVNGVVGFASGRGRASHMGAGEGIQCVTVDGFCGYNRIGDKGLPVNSIKIDAEGADEAVLEGAANTLFCRKPAVCVAVYHRTEDIVRFPAMLSAINYKYKFYIRRKEYVPAWDVFLYAIPEE